MRRRSCGRPLAKRAGPELREQLAAGNATYLDWRTLRQLDGIAKRVWVYLEGECYKPTGDGEAASSSLRRLSAPGPR